MADETFMTPLMHRDLIGAANMSAPPMGMGMGLGLGGTYNPYMNTNYLGGVTMQAPLAYDVYGNATRARQRNIDNAKTIFLGVLGVAGAAFAGIKINKLFKSIGKLFKSGQS